MLRRSFAVLFILIIGMALGPTPLVRAATSRFSDLSRTHPAHVYVEFLAATGVVNGYPDGRFGPDDPLIRAAAVKIGVGVSEWAVRSFGLASPFPDLEAAHWSTPFVTPALDEGLVLGFDDGSFRPDAPLTRAQLATLAVAAGLMDAPNNLFRPEATATRAEAAQAFAAASAYSPTALARPLTALLTPSGTAVEATDAGGIYRRVTTPTQLTEGDPVRAGADSSATV